MGNVLRLCFWKVGCAECARKIIYGTFSDDAGNTLTVDKVQPYDSSGRLMRGTSPVGGCSRCMVTRVTVGRQGESLSGRGCSIPSYRCRCPRAVATKSRDRQVDFAREGKGVHEIRRSGTYGAARKSRCEARVHHSKHIDRPCQDSRREFWHGPLFVNGKCRLGVPASLRWDYFLRRLERQIHHVGPALVSKTRTKFLTQRNRY